jgi:cyanate permease
MGVVFAANYSLIGRRRSRQQQSALGDRLHKSQDQVGSVFEGTHRIRVCIHMLIGVSAHMCMSMCICTMFIRKKQSNRATK